MIKAMRALTRYAAAGIEDTGQGDSDFRVLEVLLHRGSHHHQTKIGGSEHYRYEFWVALGCQ
jgi:hypothetical protein